MEDLRRGLYLDSPLLVKLALSSGPPADGSDPTERQGTGTQEQENDEKDRQRATRGATRFI